MPVHSRSNEAEECVVIVRFSEPAERLIVELEEFVRIGKRSRHQDHGHLRILDLNLLEKFNAVQARHAIVGDHGIETSFVQLYQGGATIASRDHRISRMIQ